MQFSPRVGFAWDPTGDGRMSVRTGYSLAYDFVNAQFHLNTSVAPPFNAEARVDEPGGRLRRSVARHAATRRSSRSRPDRTRRSRSPGPYISIPSDIEPPRQQSWNVSVQRQIGDNLAVSATYLGSYSDRLWNVRSLNPGVYIPGSCTLQTPTGPQSFTRCSTDRDAQLPPRAHDAELRRPASTWASWTSTPRSATRSTTACCSACSAAAPTAHRQRQLHAVEVHGPADAGRHDAERRHRLRRSRTTSDYDYGPCDTDRRHLFNMTAQRADAGVRERGAAGDRVELAPVGHLPRLLGRAAQRDASRPTRRAPASPASAPNLVLDDPYGDESLNNYLNRGGVRRARRSARWATCSATHRRARAARPSTCRWCARSGSARTASRRASRRSTRSTGSSLEQPAVTNRNNVQFGRITCGGRPADHAVRAEVSVLEAGHQAMGDRADGLSEGGRAKLVGAIPLASSSGANSLTLVGAALSSSADELRASGTLSRAASPVPRWCDFMSYVCPWCESIVHACRSNFLSQSACTRTHVFFGIARSESSASRRVRGSRTLLCVSSSRLRVLGELISIDQLETSPETFASHHDGRFARDLEGRSKIGLDLTSISREHDFVERNTPAESRLRSSQSPINELQDFRGVN